MTAPHTLSAVDRELGDLNASIAAMGGLVVDQIERMLAALHRGDGAALAAVAARDAEVDAAQTRVEERVMSVLATMQPMARDLRAALAGQMVALELERSGDHVKRIAKDFARIPGVLPSEVVSRLLWFGNKARSLLQRSIDAYMRADASEVGGAWADDVELDRMHKEFIGDLMLRMRASADWVDIGVRLMGIAKSLERIGDHGTNVAEQARFVAIGEVTPAHRGGAGDAAG
ncbi:MAG: phosphate signaling complex protein PhoU [Gammaproteobacteria bacterium]|nr:phosphate signaling complex protein PhoU [Gammaproteobacteria bacterium]